MNPPLTPAEETAVVRERLRLLSWAYYISGGLTAAFSAFFLLYVLMFGAMSFMPEATWNVPPSRTTAFTTPTQVTKPEPPMQNKKAAPSPLILFRIIAEVMAFFVVCGWILAGLTIYAGRCLQKKKHRIFIIVMGCINIPWIPYGTLLGIFTILALQGETAKREFSSALPKIQRV